MSGNPLKKKELIYRRSEYLALRNESDGYYLCQALQHVYATSTQFKIQWLSERPQQADTYKLDYLDHSQPECIITHVKLSKIVKDVYRLPENQKAKIKKHLNEVLHPDEEEDEEEEEEEEEVEMESEEEEEKAEEKESSPEEGDHDSDSDGEPAPKKRRGSPPTKGKGAARPKARARSTPKSTPKKAPKKKVVASKSKLKKSVSKKKEPKKSKKKPEKPEKPKKRRLTPEEKANPNLLLVPNTKVKVWNKDPFIHTNEKVPYVSSIAHGKLAFRAVALNDMKLLQSLIDNVKNVSRVAVPHSLDVHRDPVTEAIKQENHKAIQIILKEVYHRAAGKKPRCAPPRCLIDSVNTGRYNRASLGIRAVRKISMSRGCKEGNNALIKNNHATFGLNQYLEAATSAGVSMKTMNVIVTAVDANRGNNLGGDHIRGAIQYGHRKLAAALIEERERRGDSTFNKLAKEVLQNDTEPIQKTGLREASVKKKAWDNENITPIHCAAINPNTKYLIALFGVLPEYGIPDQKNRRPIHYAAGCEGTGPLEYLINKGVDPSEPDLNGFTPLMMACKTGRVHNVDLLLTHAKESLKKSEENDEDEEEDEDEDGGGKANMMVDRYGVGGINRPNQRPNKHHSLCPIHIAIKANEKEVVACLIKHGVDVHKQLSAGKNKKTPLMVAACVGNLDILKMLIKEKARVEEKDKLHRTALLHAVLNGHAHIASYLLSLGASPDQADSSGNTCCHYAAAYGWYFCLKVLIDAGANPTLPNDWKVTPLGIAFLKGHLGLVDFLLQQPGIDINFKDDQGMTLLALACSSKLDAGLSDEVSYLVDKKAADSTIKDVNGNTALHHLALNTVNVPGHHWNPQLVKDAISQSIKIANILLRSGCSAADKNNEGFTPVMAAISEGNTDLVKVLMEKGGDFSACTNPEGQNALHLMAERCMQSNLGPLVEILDKSIKKGSKSTGNVLHEMADAYDKEGLTPLLRACRSYSNWSGSPRNGDERNGASSDEEDDEGSNSGYDEDQESSEDSDDAPTKGRKRSAPKRNQSKGSPKRAKTSPEDTSWEYGRKFIRVLLELCNSDPKLPSRPQEYKKGEKVPDKEKERYLDSDKAKFTPLFYVLTASCEPSVVSAKGEVGSQNPLLSILEKHLTNADVNVRNLDGNTPLLTALNMSTPKTGDAVKRLLKLGADVNMKSMVKHEPQPTPLMKAVLSQKSTSVLKLLLAAKAEVNAYDTDDRNTALHFAVTLPRDKVDVFGTVKVLIEAGATVNATNKKGRTPLHLSVASNTGTSDATSELEAYLIDKGANVWQKDYRGRIPMHYVFTGIGVKYYQTLDLDPIELCTTMTSYMTMRSIDVADNKKMTPLHYAARSGASVCCTHLIQKKCDINAKDARGNTPLTLAAIHRHETCTIMLIQKNADITTQAVIVPEPVGKKATEDRKEGSDSGSMEESNAEDEESMKENHVQKKKGDDSEDESDGEVNLWQWKPWRKVPTGIRRYPVFQVCVKNDWAGVIFLMLDMLNASFTMNNAIEAALNTGRYNLVLTLIRKVKNNKVLQETNSHSGRTLMHTLAVKASTTNTQILHDNILIRVADALKQRGVPLNTADKYGCRPIHYAALMHNVPIVKYLIENLSSENILAQTDVARRTPLAAVFWECGLGARAVYGQFQALDDVDLDERFVYSEPLMSFGSHEKKARKQEELEAEYIADRAGIRCTPLIRAIQLQDFETAKMLLKDGADPDAKDSRLRSPLVHAIKRNDIHLVKLLLNHNYKKPDEAEIDYICYDENDATTTPAKRSTWKRPRARFNKGRASARQGPRVVFTGPRAAFTLGHRAADNEESDEANDSEPEELPRRDTDDINMRKYPTYKRVSAVQMDVKDDDGLTLVHHLVIPLKDGTFDNVGILKILHDAGAPIAEKDNTGLTPLDYALNHNAPTLAKALQKLMGIPLAKWAQPTLLSPSAISDGLNWTPLTLFSNDAESLALKMEEEEVDVEGEDDKPEPDKHLEMEDNGEVLMDEEQDIYYDVTMTKIDVKGNYGWGQYSFYIMQVVKHKAKDLWILFNRWGRIGDDGQFQRTPYGKKEDVVKEFAKIFKSKSGNAWENVKRFEPKPKKYRLIEAEDRRKLKNLKDVDFDLRTDVGTKLPGHLLNLMKSFTEGTMLQNAYVNCSIDEDLMPFGRIRKEAIVKATASLNKITPLVEEIEKMKEKPITDMDLFKSKLEQIESLSNEVYQLVPESGYEYTAITPIDNKSTLKSQMERLTNLVQLELASTILAGAMYRRKEIHPMDYVYRSIGTTLKRMEPEDPETQYLLKYIQTGMQEDGIDNRSIEGIYEVHRPGEFQRLNKLHLGNHRLLFHGTRTANLISILHRGLLVAPPGALITGHLYGKGIYTSDMFCKSAAYCDNDGSTTRDNFVLICEVALGNMLTAENFDEDEPLGKHDSHLVPGERGPPASYNVTLRDGAILPLGNLVTRKVTGNNSWWMNDYSEFIVPTAEQVRLRYLVHFKL